MSNLLKFNENETDIIYMINSELQGLVSVPKDLNTNIKVFILFKNSKENIQGIDSLSNEILEISRKINNANDNGICIAAFMENALSDGNAITYTNELNKVKSLVNTVYNALLKEGKFTKDNFIKKLELLSKEDNFKNFIDFLCLLDPSKFHANSYQDLMSKNAQENTVNNPNMNIQANNATNNVGMFTQNNIQPVAGNIPIGGTPMNYQYNGDTSGGGGPSNNISNNKILVKKLPHNAAFIKLPAVILILIMSLVIGISFSVYLLK